MKRNMRYFIMMGLGVLLVSVSCSHKKDNAIFELMENTGIDFSNTVKSTRDFNVFTFRNFYNGGGVALGDINNDGLADVFLTANMGSNKLYINRGNWKFEDVSPKAGFVDKLQWSTGAVMVDINNDGWLDIYVSNSAHLEDSTQRANQLFINNHDLSFTESAKQYGLADKGYSTQASFFDYDQDGDLDCFIINNSPIPVNTLNYVSKRNLLAENWPVADFLKGGGDHLLRNDNGKFIEVTASAGIHGTLISLGLGVSVGDINGDAYPDIYVSNDFFERDYLYVNQKNGTFKDEFEEWIGHGSLASMGADIGDINNDDYPDIFTTDMLPKDELRIKTTSSFDNIDVYQLKVKSGFHHQFMQNTLQVNNKNNKFLETAFYSGVAASDWSWGALLFDADNDGLTDIYVCNGINLDVTDQDFIDFFANDIVQKMAVTGKKEQVDSIIQRMPSNSLANKAFKNMGNLKFADVGDDWGFSQQTFSNGAAYADLDNDGDLDMIINNVNQPASIYRNNSREKYKNNYIGVTLKGNDKNTFAIGSKIKIYKGEQIFSHEVIPCRGFQSSMDYKQIVGLGNITRIDSMIIIWPDRSYSKYENVALNKVHVLQQPKKGIPFVEKGISITPLFQPVPVTMDKHVEDDYLDFYYERNLPELLSREGPHIAKGDVNGDGLDDIYLAGAKGQAGQLYFQTADGFAKHEEPVFKQFADFEDVAVLFFDADKDGDLDLYIGAGGNNVLPNNPELQHRLYKNNGKGNFEIDAKAFPANDMNISVAVNYDYDDDGDEDLFIGSGCVSLNYGITPQSYIYQNDGSGHFTDVTKMVAPAIAKAGMVTSATWANISGDTSRELVITGKWMTTRIFSYNKNSHLFDELKQTNLENLFGWWQTIAAADLNGDGKEDLVIGNIGENFYLKADSKNPVKLWLNDFDKNGTTDQFLTRSIDGKDIPVFLKKEITDQFPALKKENLKHRDYAKKSIQDLFNKDVIGRSSVKQLNYCSSIVAINNGKGGFTIEPLPAMVQLSSVNAIAVTDINNDKKPDLIMGGNKFGFQPQFGRLDASQGHVLLNNGKGFNWVEPKLSGLVQVNEIRDIKVINKKDKRFLLIVQNDQYPVMYQFKK